MFNALSRLKKSLADIHDIRAVEHDVMAFFELFESDPAVLEDVALVKECQDLVEQFSADVGQLELKSLLSGPHDAHNAIVSFFSGAGGTDAQDWTQMLYRMYLRWFEKKGFSFEVVDYSMGDEAGIKSATVLVSGEYAYGFLRREQGIHRLVRQSPFNANSKRQTSFAAVDVFPEVESTVSSVSIDSKDLKIDTYRASGAGGQHVNKTDSAVRITHLPTGLVATSQASRSQGSNKETAMKILTSRLLILLQEQKADEISQLKGEQKENAWGNQIRSYVLHPYKLIKDLRSEYETSNVQQFLDGDLDACIHSLLHLIKS